MVHRFLGLVVVGFLSFLNGFSQAAFDSIRTVKVEDGMPQGWISDIAQDKQGFIWMAANRLYRYDGRNFKLFAPQLGNTVLPNIGQLERFHLDPEQNLWLMYADNHVIRMNTRTGAARYLTGEPGFAWLRQNSNRYTIFSAAGEYFAASQSVLLRFNPASGAYNNIVLPSNELFVSLYGSRQGRQYIATSKALYRLQGETLLPLGHFPALSAIEQKFQDSISSLMFSPSKQIVETRKGDLLIAVAGGICRYQPHTGELSYQPVKGVASRIESLLPTREGDSYFIQPDGLHRINQNGQPSDIVIKTAAPLDHPMLQDQSGIVWVATANATGLYLFRTHHSGFQSFAYSNSFSHDVMERWLHNPMEGRDLGSYGFRCAADPAGNVWVIKRVLVNRIKTGIDSTFTYQISRQGIRSVSLAKGTKPHNITFTTNGQCWMMVEKDHQNYLVNADTGNGTYRILSRFATYPPENDYLTSIGRQLAVIFPDSVMVYDTATGARKVFSREKLGCNMALLMATPDPKDQHILWIATNGSGMVKLNIETGHTTRYTDTTGLPNNTVYFIAVDKKGLFWCSSNKGIFRFNPADGQVVSFTTKDGLQGNEYNRHHFLRTPDGHFIFGGTNGYTIFHPDSVWIDSFQPPVVLSEIVVNNAPLAHIVPAYSQSVVSDLATVQLSHDQNFITFNFAGLEYDDPYQLRYRYMLEGFDKDWVVAGRDASAKYTFIPPGEYTFKVTASNTLGIWGSTVSSVRIIILPPWWRTGWAYCLYVLLVGGIVYALYRNWLHRVQARQQIVLKQREAEQLKEIDAIKDRFFSNITHEFRTPLSLILAPLEAIRGNAPDLGTQQKVDGVERNAQRLLQLINQLLDLAKLEAASMRVELSRGQLSQFVGDIAASFLPQAGAKKIFLTYNIPTNDTTYLIDYDKLQKILQNLLSNAIKFTPAGGSVQLQAEVQTEAEQAILQVVVKDSGKGIPPAQLPFIFNRFYQVADGPLPEQEGTGIGLALVKELTDLMQGTITVASTATEPGTIFTLRLPLQQAMGEATLASYQLPEPDAVVGYHYQNGNAVPAANEVLDKEQPLILVTEDDPELNAFIADTFRPQYRVMTAANGKAGWETARKELPDLIISDARMPEMDGYSFCRHIKQSTDTSHIGFVLLTAKAAPHSVAEGLQSQADDYITKPFRVSELTLRVTNLLTRQQTLRNYYRRQLTQPGEPLIANEHDNVFLQQLYGYLQQHLDDPNLTVAAIATAVSTSQRTLTRKLSMLLGLSPVDLIKQYRLKKAAELLLTGDSVAEVAYRVGYETATYFSTSFKNFYGTTPTDYVKKNRR